MSVYSDNRFHDPAKEGPGGEPRKPGEEHIWMKDGRAWWHNEHPLDTHKECCTKALEHLFARVPEAIYDWG